MIKLFLAMMMIMIVALSCTKSDDKPKILGCIDSLSINYNKQANTDDGSCVFPADKLVGTWSGKDEVRYFNGTTFTTTNLPTVTYTATISKTDKTKIKIVGTQPTKPVYLYNGALSLKWKEKIIEVSGTTITGTITNENNFTYSYVYGVGGGAYTVKQTYTR